MKKIILAFLILSSTTAFGQIYNDGTVIQGFSATDINNNFFSSTVANNAGKHILIDFSATWCGNCWAYHNSKVLEDYYNKFGPSGTDAQDAEVLFYEADASTNTNDLNGIGTNTVGNWVTGTSYTIFNEASVMSVRSSFSNNGVLGYPTVFLVTASKEMYRIPTNITDVDQLRDFVNQKAGLTPLNTNTVSSLNFAYDVYPNPATDNLSIDINLNKSSDLSVQVLNTFGQSVYSYNNMQENVGGKKIEINTSDFSAGLYIIQLVVGEERTSHKVIIQK